MRNNKGSAPAAPVTHYALRITHSNQRSHAPVPVARRPAPDAGEWLATVRAQPVGAYPAFQQQESVPLDHGRVAVVAAGVLPLADLARQIAGIHVFQPGLLSQVDDPHQV